MSAITSTHAVLPHENREEYERLHAEFRKHHQPGSGLELELVARMADCWWKLRRAQRVEAAFLSHRIQAITEAAGGEISPDAAMARIFADPQESRQFTILQRYLTAAEREWRSAQKQFEQTKRERQEREESEVLTTVMAATRPAAATPTPAGAPTANGFVSQKSADARHAHVSLQNMSASD